MACALTALAALAESALAVQIGRDDQVESLLRRADELVAEGRLADAVKTLLLVEDRAAAARAEDPTVRPLVLGPDGVYRSPGHEVWRRVVAGGADALAAYRAARAPLVRELIASALAPPRDVAALAAVGRTYPLVEGAAEGLVRLGDLLLERGEVEQALAAYTAAKAKAPGRPALAPTLLASAEAASAQARALVERMRRGAAASDRDAERRAARRWPMPGGAPDRARASPEAILPGAPLWELPLASGDLAAASLAGFARRGFAPPLLWRPVTCGERVYVQDARTVVAVDLERGQASWRYTASDPQDDREDPARVPERVRASYLAPTVLGGRVYATLNRNTPPIYEPYEGPPEKGQQLVSRRADDWRLVALDAETGALAWDAMRAPAVAAATRAARAISSPLVAYGQVFVTLVEGDAGELSTLLLAFDQATGALAWRMFLGSASLENFLDLASLLPPPSAREGRVFVQGLGLVACVDPLRQDLEWVHAHPAVPAASFKRVIERDRRFDLAPPVVQGSVVVCAPPDAVYLLGLDASTGRERWRMPRGALTQVLGVARGRVIVAGAAGGRAVVLAIDPATGLVAWRRSLEAQGLAGRGVASEARVLVPLAEGWVALGADDGAIEARGYLPAGTPAAGHWLALPGRLVYASAHSIALYEPRERSLTRLAVAGERGDPGTADAYAALLAATGRPKDALSVIERAVERAFDPARQAALAAIGFDIGRRADRERARAGDEEAALDLGVLASRFVRGRTGEAAYLATLTERLLAAGRAGDAALVLQRVGVTGRGARIAVAFGVEAPAAAWARERLRRLRRDAPAAFAAHDDLAARAFGRATEARAPEAYEEVIRAFPGSRYEQLALLALADLHESRELASQAARALEDHDRRFPDHAEAVSVLLRLARIYLATGRLEDERRALGELARRFGDVRLEGESETIGAFARRRLASIDAAPRAPRLQLGSEPSALGKTFQAWTDLAAEEPRVIAPPGLDPERAPFALVAAERSLAAHDPDTGALLWRWEAPPAAAGASAELHHGRIALAGGALALVHQGGLQALDAATGRWLWRHDAADLLSLDPGAAPRPERLQLLALGFDGASGPRWPVDYLLRELQAAIGPVRPAVDPDPIRGLQPAGDRLVANVAGAVVCLDGARGTLLWRTRRSERLSGAPLVGPDGAGGSIVLVRQEAPAVLIGLDLQTGAERWVARPGERDPRLTLAPVVPPLAPERAFFVADANRLMAISFADGAVETLRQLPFWPRELVPEPSGRAVCVIPHRGPQQPAAVVYQSRTGEELCQLEAPDALRVNRAEFLDDELYLLAGDYRDAQLYAVNWSTGQARWTWTPQRGHSFQELLVTRDHVILPRTAARPGMVYVVDRALGSVHRTLEIPRRRVVNAALIRGVLCVSTNRGLLGYGRLDPARLLEEQGELAARLALSPDDSSLVLALADRQFKAGELDLALATLGRGLEREGLDQRAHATLLRQLLGYQEGLDEGPEVEVGRVARAPLIDGELSDPWPLEQSFVLSSARHVMPLQGYPELKALRGDDDLSAVLYTGWDARYFYVAIDVTDSVLVPYDSEAEVWRGDCLLLAIDSRGNGGDYFLRDDNLISLALALPKKKKDPDEEEPSEESEEAERPDGKFFVKRKDDGTGAVYEAAIPWSAFAERGAEVDPATGPAPGFQFGFNVIVTDADDNRGARQVLQWAPAIQLHRDKRRLWEGFIPGRFVRVRLR